MTREEGLRLISKSSIYGNLGLFVGAGMSMDILNDEWNTVALSWKELIYKCGEEFEIKIKEDIQTEGLSYPEIATELAKLIAIRKEVTYKEAVKVLKQKIANLTSWYPRTDERLKYGKILKDLSPNWIITTNYDLILESLLTGECLSLGPDDQLISPQNLIPIYHLHGIRTNPDSIIISQEDYISLFRPNQYRQQKLSLSIKESTTLIIGYGLGDVNVLTAVDWTKNVYSNQRISYPHEIIQLLYTDSPKEKPYKDRNDILIIEFNDLKDILQEIIAVKKDQQLQVKENTKALTDLNKLLSDPTENSVKNFIDEEDFRLSVIEMVTHNGTPLISGFLELFSKSIDKTWERAQPRNAFFAYDENLVILLDILENIELSKIPPALLESVVYNLSRVSHYIGNKVGQSRAAHLTWNRRKNNIPEETIEEIYNIALSRDYSTLLKLVQQIRR